MLVQKNDHPVPYHYGSGKGSPCILSDVRMDHTVSCDYDSLCILWLWTTLYSFTMDHPVFWSMGARVEDERGVLSVM